MDLSWVLEFMIHLLQEYTHCKINNISSGVEVEMGEIITIEVRWLERYCL